MDNLDSLSNDELRLRLLECGFANMPVTVNTRKLIVKKLRKHLEAEKSKLRRETIHVTKYSSDEESSDADSGKKKSSATTTTTTSKTTRRATVGGGDTTASSYNTSTSTSKANVRRSGRVTPLIESGTKDSGKSAPPNVPDILEDTDEEVIVVKPSNARRSKSKTPVTLSKTEPVTISVRHIKPTLENVIEHEIELNDESEEEFMSPAPRSPVKPPPKFSPQKDYSTVISSSSSSTTTRKKTLFGPGDDEFQYSSSNIHIPLSQSKMYESNFLNNRNKPTSGLGSSFQPRHSISTSYNNRYNSSTSSSGANKFGSNEFGYSGITSTTYAKPKTYSQEEQEEDDYYEEPVTQEKKLEKEVMNSPYLSKFAKRLSELRVDPLIPPGGELQTQSKVYYTQTEMEPSRNIDRYSTNPKLSYQRRNITSRQSINSYKKDKNSFVGQLRYEWNELNNKYKINRNLAILFIFLVIIFIIVLIFF